jgi:hypothetical protein
MGGGGKGGSDTPKIDKETRKFARQSTFKPYTLTTSVGTTAYDKDKGFSVELGQPLRDIQQEGYLGAQQLMGGIPEAFGREVTPFGFERDLEGRTADIFREQSALLEPAFAQQRQKLQSDLFGSGRMGLMLAGEAAGAGAGGMVSPDAFGLGRAQSQTLANLAAQSRQQALGEQKQAYGIESGIFGTNEAMQQQRAQNLLTGSTGMLGFGEAITARESELMRLGLTAEQARGAASAQGASAFAQGQQAAAAIAQATPQEPDLLGQVLEGAARVGAAYVTGGMSEAALAGSQVAGGGGFTGSMNTGMTGNQFFGP